MSWDDIALGFMEFIFSMLAAVISVIISPVDLLIDAVVPAAGQAITEFFQWANTMIMNFLDFINWFLYVLGITPNTWALMVSCASALLMVFIFLFPVKMIFSVFRGMKQ